MLDAFDHHSFVLYNVDKSFCPTSNFKEAVFSVNPVLEHISSKNHQVSINCDKLFQVKELLDNLPADIENRLVIVQKFMKGECSGMTWPNVPCSNNMEIMVDLAKKVSALIW